MFYCGYDPGFEAYLATKSQDLPPNAVGQIWVALVLAGLAVLGLGGVGFAAMAL